MQKFATSPTKKYPNGRRLPKFSDDQLVKLIGSYDFLGINYYTANFSQFQAPAPDVRIGYLTDRHYTPSGNEKLARFNLIGSSKNGNEKLNLHWIKIIIN